jgi:hypothetical protein
MTTATSLTTPPLVALFEWCFNKQHDVASDWNSRLGPDAWRRASVVAIYVTTYYYIIEHYTYNLVSTIDHQVD